MHTARRFELAERMREHRLCLERTLNEIAARGTPLTRAEARLIVETTELRLAEVERELRPSLPLFVERLSGRMRRIALRLHGLWQPRIGRLRHYPARTLQVPARYRNT